MWNRFLAAFEDRFDPARRPWPARPQADVKKFLLASAGPFKKALLAMMALSALVGAGEALMFAALGAFGQWLAQSGPGEFWGKWGWPAAGIGAGLLLLQVASAAQSALKNQALGANWTLGELWDFHRLALGQSMSFYQGEFSGRIAAKVQQTAPAAREAVMIIADIGVYVLAYFASMGAVAWSFHPWLAAPFAAWAAAYAALVVRYVPRMRACAKEGADARSRLSGRIADAYSNALAVKLFGGEGKEAEGSRGEFGAARAALLAQGRAQTGMETAVGFLNAALFMGILLTCAWLSDAGWSGSAAVGAAGAMALRLIGFSHWLMWESGALSERWGVLRDGLELLSRDPEVKDLPNARELSVPEGGAGVEFRGVCFSYGEKRVFEDFTLCVPAGQKVGLVGVSGSGKSTLMSLALRLFDPDSGQVLVGGQDIRLATQASLRKAVALVSQESQLFHASAEQNVAYGMDRRDAGSVRLAGEMAHCGFVEDLEDDKGNKGWQAILGERGAKLSGGQKQRLSIARVMLRDSPVLLLDEATSALDSESEHCIQAAFAKLMEGKTVIAIAHRLSTIAKMDRIVVLDRGRIAQDGTHKELLEQGGLYAKLWSRQSGGFLQEEEAG